MNVLRVLIQHQHEDVFNISKDLKMNFADITVTF